MLCALIDSNYVVVDIRELTSEEVTNKYSQLYPIIIDISNISPIPSLGWIFNGQTIIPPQNWDQMELVCSTIYDPLLLKFSKIKRRFIGENIAMGIAQSGKTEAVGNFMAPIELWFERVAPFPTIKYIEIAKLQLQNDPDLAANLAPFITVARLDNYKLQILQALGLA